MTWQIWLAVLSVVFIVYGLVKRWETRMLLVVSGFVLCAASGAPMKAFEAFVKGMTSLTLVPPICAAMGFAYAVQASQCDRHLVAAVAAPLKKLGGFLIPMTTVLTFLINIAIMSAAGTAATAGATFIPLLLRSGIRPAAAAAAVGGGTMAGLLLNPGCAHDIYVAKMSDMDLMAFIGWAAPYVVGLTLVTIVVNSLLMLVKHKDHLAADEARAAAETSVAEKDSAKENFKIHPLKAVAPLVPLVLLICASVWFPRAGVDVVAAMLAGLVFIAAVTLMNPGEISKAFFKGCGAGYAQVIGLIVAAGVFAAGLQATGAVSAFIELLKGSNEFARWGAAFGPFLMALGTGSGEAAIWAFNQAVTPSAASFGMESHALGLLAILAGQFGRTASPLAGAVIIVAGMASADPVQVAKRLLPGMLAAVVLSALILV